LRKQFHIFINNRWNKGGAAEAGEAESAGLPPSVQWSSRSLRWTRCPWSATPSRTSRDSAAAAHARGESLAVEVKAMHDEVVPYRGGNPGAEAV